MHLGRVGSLPFYLKKTAKEKTGKSELRLQKSRRYIPISTTKPFSIVDVK